MKKILFSLCVFLLSGIAFPTLAAEWSLVSRGNTQNLHTIFLDGANLIAVGNQGTILVSSDNGSTWSSSNTNSSIWLSGMTKQPNGDLLVVGEGGIGLSSSDHGKTWTQMSFGVTKNLHAISSKNQTGYLIGTGGTFLTLNGSTNTWSTSSLDVTDDLYGVQDMGDGSGWVVGANGDIFHLTLSGLSYAKITLSTKETLRSVKFTDVLNGWIVGTQGTILQTIDGGSTWNSVVINGITTQALYSIDALGNHVAIAGDKVLVTSEDAGKTWNVKSFADTLNTFYGVVYKDADSVFAVGSDFDVSSLIYKLSASPVVVPVPVVPVQTEGTAAVGSLVKLKCGSSPDVNDPCKAVYFYATDGKRHAFPNDKIYFSWFEDFSTVKEVNAGFLASLSLGKNVTYRPGVKMVKFQTSPQVYVVAKGGVLRAVASEQIASALYGLDWNKKIDDISDVFFLNYTFGEVVLVAGDYNPVTARVLVGGLSENF